MSLTKLLPVILLMMATGVQASTRDEIERLWNPQGMAAQPAQPAADTSARTEKPAPRWFRLSNGRQVNLADWKVVLFMQGHCPYCHQFDPVLKQLAQQYGFSVYRSVSMQRVRLRRHNRKWPGKHRTEQKVPCMGSAAVLPVPGTRSVSLVLTGGAVILSPVVLTAR